MKLNNEPMALLREIITNGGPEQQEYEALNDVFETVSTEFRAGNITAAELDSMQAGFGAE
jgi:extracellular factor (EF) 3-hydroxypalmitic acid methyl ester biosynthesis protein